MLRKTLALLSVIPLLLVARASAITYGVPDDGDHPNVGAVIRQFPSGERELWCSGVLISPAVFLTAAHCVDDGDQYFITLDQEYTPQSKLYAGTIYFHPDYTRSQDDPHDLAVIVFARPFRGIPPAALPPEGLLDRMAADHSLQEQRFTAVGYGVHEPNIGGGPPSFDETNDRWRAVSSFNALTKAWLRLSQNDATGDGGTCRGDSGGPDFLGAGADETPIVAAITVTGDFFCNATNVTYRLDTASARAFLGSFVILP